jgi:hypothetical protein
MICAIAKLNIYAYGSERNAIDYNRRDRVKPPARRGCSAYASESDTTNLSAGGSIINSGFSGLGYIISRIIIVSKY